MLHGGYVVLVTPAQMVAAMRNIVLPTIAPRIPESVAVDPALNVAGTTAPRLPVLARPQQLGAR